MKTRHPMIVTAHIAQEDLAPFDRLRRIHFPPKRNSLHAHLTIFHRLPGEYCDRIISHLGHVANEYPELTAQVDGVRHLGAGVAFSIANNELAAARASLKLAFSSWLGPQDKQKWQPHITIQNGVPRRSADRLYGELLAGFRPQPIRITGFDLWRYLDGPWDHMITIPLKANHENSDDGDETRC
jgi:2'-5' RNA ligase